jgi:hypothetical protein
MLFSGYRYRGRLEKLIEQWTEYRQLVLTRMGAADLKASDERRFLKLKGKMVEELAALSDQQGFDAAHEAQTHVRAISNLLNRFPTLYADTPLDSPAKADFEREWHSHFLFLNKLKGHDQTGAAPRDSRAGAAAAAQVTEKKSTGRRLARTVLRLATVVVTFALVIHFVPWNRLIPEDQQAKMNMRELPSFLSSLWDSVSHSFRSLAAGGILKPVENQYGSEVSSVLVAVLLLALGYWIFIRTK